MVESKWLNCSESENTWDSEPRKSKVIQMNVDDFEKEWQAAYDETHRKRCD